MNFNEYPVLWQQPKIYLCRHATPDWSRTDIRYDIPPGPPLTDVGESEAIKLGEFLRKSHVSTIYFSPLERTRRTAELAAEVAGITPIEELAIREMQHSESASAVLQRVRPFWEQAVHDSMRHGPIALITHGGPVTVMLEDLKMSADALNFYKRQFDRGNPVPPAGVWLTTRANHDVTWQLELVFTPQPAKLYQAQTTFV